MLQDQTALDEESIRFWQVLNNWMTAVDAYFDFINFHLERLNGQCHFRFTKKLFGFDTKMNPFFHNKKVNCSFNRVRDRLH